MRTIKFRAWSRKEKVMTGAWSLNEIPVAILTKKLDCEVMQFTGLLDKNGREIYEGDILADDWWRTPVIFENTMFCLASTKPGRYVQGLKSRVKRGMVVIGNIYENPELLEPKP